MNRFYTFALGMLTALSASTAVFAEKSPGYLDCDGTRYMRITNSTAFDIPSGGTRTVSMKVQVNKAGAYAFMTNRVRRYQSSNNNDVSGFCFYTTASATTVSYNYPTTAWTARHCTRSSTIAASSTVWTHLCWVYSGSTAYLYIDGTPYSATISSMDIPSYCDLLVGAGYTMTDNVAFSESNLTQFLNGRIDDLRIYAEALTSDEVTSDRNSTAPLEGKTLIAGYNFDDISGTTVPDISGNGHNGTLVGSWPAYDTTVASSYAVTIETPVGGSIKVLNGETLVNSGDEVAVNSQLTITATPDDKFELKSITANGAPIQSEGSNSATYTVTGATTIAAAFTYAASEAPAKVPVFSMYEEGSKFYRIPGLVRAKDGSLVAVADKRGDAINDLPNTISVVAKRSTDNGATWSSMSILAQGNSSTGKTYGDPAIVLDSITGKIFVFFSGDKGFWTSTKTSRAGIYYCVSEDNGQTWSGITDVTATLYQSTWYGAFIASGRGVQLSSGRLCFVANVHTSATAGENISELMVYSDDHGATWKVSTSNAAYGYRGNESKIVELTDGSLLMSIRNYEGNGYRRFNKSTNQGTTWGSLYTSTTLPGPSCNGDIIRYPSTDGKTRLLHSLPASTSTRRDVSIYISYDEGTTWQLTKTLINTYSAYSSLEILKDGSIGCLVEEGKWDSNIAGDDGFNLYFMRFTLDWLTDGQDTHNPFASDSSTAIDNVKAEASGRVEYYNLQGMRVKATDLHDGIYIRKQGSKASKVVVQ